MRRHLSTTREPTDVLSKRTAKRLALGGIGLGVANLALVVYQMWAYEQPDNGGTSLAGLFFFFALVIAAATIVEAVIGWVLLRRRPPSPWVHRLTISGLAGAVCAGLAQGGWNLLTVLDLDVLDPVAAVALLGLVVGAVGIGLGTFVEIGRSVQRTLAADPAE
jgi:hypothetical protein